MPGASVVKLEADPSIEGGKQPPSLLAPKPEPKDVNVEDPPAAAATTASKKRPWLAENARLPFSALSRAEMAARFGKASEHLMTELDGKVCLTPDEQQVEAVKVTMTEVGISNFVILTILFVLCC